jgi:hypothetical protein
VNTAHRHTRCRRGRWISFTSSPTILLGLVLVVAVVTSGRAQPDRQQGYQGSPSATAARDLYDRGRYDEARSMLDALIAARAITAEILYYRGLVEPNAELALERYFGEVPRRFPSSEWADRARFKIGEYRYASGYYITARDRFGEVAWRQGDTPLGQAARYWRAMTWTYDEAQSDSLRYGMVLLKNVATRSTDPGVLGMALVSIGEIGLRLGRIDTALAYSAQVVRAPYLEDFHARALSVQAAAFDRLRDRDQARSLYQVIANRYADTWEGRIARSWLAEQREVAVQARLDTLQGGTLDPSGAGQGDWSIQVGAFSNMANASDAVMQLTRNDYAAWHTTKRVGGRSYVVVLVGHFETRAEAVAFGNNMIERQHITEFTPYKKP